VIRRLFVAPTESSLASKAAKTTSTSPPRSGIRRPASPESRDRRTRRITRIHDALNRYSSSGNNDEGSDSPDQYSAARRAGFRITPRHDHIVTSGIPSLGGEDQYGPNALARVESVMRRAFSRHSTGLDQEQRQRVEERFQSLFGSTRRDAERDNSLEALGLNDNEQDAEAYMLRGGRPARRARIV
jgi:hypothetical protein